MRSWDASQRGSIGKTSGGLSSQATAGKGIRLRDQNVQSHGTESWNKDAGWEVESELSLRDATWPTDGFKCF